MYRIIFLMIVLMINTRCSEAQTESFDYREVYFPQVTSQPNFFKTYKTMPLDTFWGLWGHNLKKWVDLSVTSENMYALVNGKRNTEQYCFSSEELRRIITKNIDAKKHSHKHFMILPNDNALVCQCKQCLAAGNTQTDAAEAVFSLLGRLAKQMPENHFYTTVYHTVKNPPKQALPQNVGVFLSTINLQYGRPYENLPQGKVWEEQIAQWKKVTPNIYVWEYALNYDNYLDLYPNLKVMQQNLRYLKSLGVKGVFVNGSETYSAMQPVKSAVLANLLLDPNADIEVLIREAIRKNYPEKIAALLETYYLTLEEHFFKSKRSMGVYANTFTAEKKYLHAEEFYRFYDEFESVYNQGYQNKETASLFLSLTFLRLELMRMFGISTLGYAQVCQKEICVHPKLHHWLKQLKNLSEETDVRVYDEKGSRIEDYLQQWQTKILSNLRLSRFLHQKFEVLSVLDEDYSTPKWLNNGAFGFLDYNNNWTICSQDDLRVKIDLSQIGQSTEIEIGFLNDPDHQIYYPQYVEIMNQNTSYERVQLPVSSEKETKRVRISLKNLKENHIILVAKLTTLSGKKALACDEISIY